MDSELKATESTVTTGSGLADSEGPAVMERRKAARVPLSTPYRWEFRERRGFFEAVASDLCEDGMFVNIANPRPAGSQIDFEVRFADGLGLIEGRGEVAWVNERGSDSEHPSGMGIRFLDLAGDSLEVVRGTLRKRLTVTD